MSLEQSRRSEQGPLYSATEVYCTRTTMTAMNPVKTLQELLKSHLPDSEFVIEPQRSNERDTTDFVFKIPRQHHGLVTSIWRSQEYEQYSWNVTYEKDQDVIDQSYQRFEEFVETIINPKQPK